jgi:hypothetical protein
MTKAHMALVDKNLPSSDFSAKIMLKWGMVCNKILGINLGNS